MKAIAYKKREEEILKKIVSLLMEDIKPNRILLFGSRADDSNLFPQAKSKSKRNLPGYRNFSAPGLP
jgi:hypothetical protein